jgi:DNA-binding GntR family transcriptional regulator
VPNMSHGVGTQEPVNPVDAVSADASASPIAKASAAAGDERMLPRPPGLVEGVYERILADLMSLQIPPGSRISVDNLARQLRVSQTPIREALSMLEGNGLVLKTRFVGYCAAPKLSRDQFENLYELRLLLEPYGARQAATHMSTEIRHQLKRLAASMESLQRDALEASYGRFAQLDSEFHALVAAGSGNPLIAESLERLHTHLHIFRLRFHAQVTSEAIVEHARIVDALLSENGSLAENAMRDHITSSHERLALHTG